MYTDIQDRQLEYDAFLAEYLPEDAPAPRPQRDRTPAFADFDVSALLEKAFKSKNGDQIKALYNGVHNYSSGSEADLALNTHLAFWFDCDAGAMDTVFRGSALYREKWERDDYRTDTIQKAIAGCSKTYQDGLRERKEKRDARAQRAEIQAPVDGDDRPTIVWKDNDSNRALMQLERAIINESMKPEAIPMFQRGARPVRIGEAVEAPTVINGIVRDGKSPAIYPVGRAYLENYATRIVRFQKYSERKQEYVDCGCPGKLADIFLDRSGEYNLPHLKAITNHPTLRPDGTIFDTPGYDAATGLFYNPCGVKFPTVPENPEPARAMSAAAAVVDVLSEFPFKEEVDRSVAFAHLLTSVVRASLPTAPATIINAHIPGSGKTELAASAGLLADGLLPDMTSFTPDEAEMHKRIFALLREGASNICIDNVEQPIKGESLCTVLTSPTFSARILGESATMRVPTCATWTATGNNIVVEGDLTRRSLLCRLDPQVERPEERQFKRNLRAFILENRPHLVSCALTFLRGYIIAPDKPQLSPYGSFQEWSDLVRGAIVWAGMADPLDSRKDIDANDPKRIALGSVLRAWRAKFGESSRFTKDAIDRQSSSTELIEALEMAVYSPKGLSTKSVGGWIKKNEGTIIDGLRFVRVGDYQKVMLWAVKSA